MKDIAILRKLAALSEAFCVCRFSVGLLIGNHSAFRNQEYSKENAYVCAFRLAQTRQTTHFEKTGNRVEKHKQLFKPSAHTHTEPGQTCVI